MAGLYTCVVTMTALILVFSGSCCNGKLSLMDDQEVLKFEEGITLTTVSCGGHVETRVPSERVQV